MITYLLPSLLASLLLNIPKFLEARLERMTYVADNVTEDYLIINDGLCYGCVEDVPNIYAGVVNHLEVNLGAVKNFHDAWIFK